MCNMAVIWGKELYSFMQECLKYCPGDVQKFTVLSLDKMYNVHDVR